jgi:hypothetical protein
MSGEKMTLPYPYFLLGFDFKITELDPEALTEALTKMSLFRRFTWEEAYLPEDGDTVRSIQMMCGKPRDINPEEPLSTCEYAPIPLKTFVDCGGIVLPEADLKDRNNIKVYLNGKPAEYEEDYVFDYSTWAIKILWNEIRDIDMFSFSIPFKPIRKGGR